MLPKEIIAMSPAEKWAWYILKNIPDLPDMIVIVISVVVAITIIALPNSIGHSRIRGHLWKIAVELEKQHTKIRQDIYQLNERIEKLGLHMDEIADSINSLDTQMDTLADKLKDEEDIEWP